MTTYKQLKSFLAEKKYKLIIVSDAQPVTHIHEGNTIVPASPAGGVSLQLEAIAKAVNGLYLARGRSEEDKQVVTKEGKIFIGKGSDTYTLKRLFFPEEEAEMYYLGYCTQTLYFLCHTVFQKPIFNPQWYAAYKKVNEKFAKAIEQEVSGKTFVWINDCQLSLIPKFLSKNPDITLGFFWHIAFPSWEIFRILPQVQKKAILESLLLCDFIGFHRGYHVRNFLGAVERELEARIDLETHRIYYNHHVTTVKNLPMGVDNDVIASLAQRNPETPRKTLSKLASFLFKKLPALGPTPTVNELYEKYKVILGVDRLDHIKGLEERLAAVDLFYTKNPAYKGKTVYVGIMAPTREKVPAYQELHERIISLADSINSKHQTASWKPIHLFPVFFQRREIIQLYKKASICIVTSLDDGMNLVSKEFVIAASQSQDPGVLILSQFAGSAIDLTQALIINPFSTQEVADTIRTAFSIPLSERKERIFAMARILEERNVYEWAQTFITELDLSSRDNKKSSVR